MRKNYVLTNKIKVLQTWRIGAVDTSVFAREHILERTHSRENTFYREHILQQTWRIGAVDTGVLAPPVL